MMILITMGVAVRMKVEVVKVHCLYSDIDKFCGNVIDVEHCLSFHFLFPIRT